MSDPTTTFTVDDQAYLVRLGRLFMEDTISIISETAMWAIYALIFSIATYIQCSRGLRTRGSVLMLLVTTILFASSTTLWALDMAVLIKSYYITLINNPEVDLTTKVVNMTDTFMSASIAMEALFLLNMILGDSVVIWRAIVISRGSKINAIPIIFLLASLAFAITDILCLTASGFEAQSTIPVGSLACAWAEPISWALSLCTNIASTCIIAWKAYVHRRLVRPTLRSRSQVDKVLVLLIESGFIYCIFWLSQMIIFFDIPRSSKLFFLYAVLSPLGDQISGLYPTIIIVLVSLQHTLFGESTCTLGTTFATTEGDANEEMGRENVKSVVFAANYPSQASDIHNIMNREKDTDFEMMNDYSPRYMDDDTVGGSSTGRS